MGTMGTMGYHISRLRGILLTGANNRLTLGPRVHCTAAAASPLDHSVSPLPLYAYLSIQREYTRNSRVGEATQ